MGKWDWRIVGNFNLPPLLSRAAQYISILAFTDITAFDRKKVMNQFHSRLILTIIQWAKLDVHFFLMKEHCRMCVNVPVCGAQPSPMAGLSGPLHPPWRWTWLSMQSHLLSAPWSWRKAVRAGGEFLLVAPLIGKYWFSTYPKCRLDDMKLAWPAHTGREEGGGRKSSWMLEPSRRYGAEVFTSRHNSRHTPDQVWIRTKEHAEELAICTPLPSFCFSCCGKAVDQCILGRMAQIHHSPEEM